MRLVKVFRQRELQGTLRITNEFNDNVQIKLLALRNGVILFLWNMTGEYHNKHFILFSIADQISVKALEYLEKVKTFKSI
jgi:hypothetical protein